MKAIHDTAVQVVLRLALTRLSKIEADIDRLRGFLEDRIDKDERLGD